MYALAEDDESVSTFQFITMNVQQPIDTACEAVSTAVTALINEFRLLLLRDNNGSPLSQSQLLTLDLLHHHFTAFCSDWPPLARPAAPAGRGLLKGSAGRFVVAFGDDSSFKKTICCYVLLSVVGSIRSV